MIFKNNNPARLVKVQNKQRFNETSEIMIALPEIENDIFHVAEDLIKIRPRIKYNTPTL